MANMKEYFSNRNEQLLKKLFEHQKITVKEIGVPEMTAWQAHVTDESERRRIEEDFKSILQETWLAEGNRALTEQELETALQSIISEKFDPDKTKIGDTDKTVQQLALAVDLKKDDSGKATAEPSQEEKIEELIKKVLSNTDDRIRALGEFYHILTKRENEANEKLGAEEAPSPEEDEDEVKEKVKDALEDKSTGEAEGGEADVKVGDAFILGTNKGRKAYKLAKITSNEKGDKIALMVPVDPDSCDNMRGTTLEVPPADAFKEPFNKCDGEAEELPFKVDGEQTVTPLEKDSIEVPINQLSAAIKSKANMSNSKLKAAIIAAVKKELQANGIYYGQQKKKKQNQETVKEEAPSAAVPDVARIGDFFTKNKTLQQYLSKIDTVQDAKGFLELTVNMMKNVDKADIIKALTYILPATKKQLTTGGTSSGGSKKGEISVTSIVDAAKKMGETQPKRLAALKRVLDSFFEKHLKGTGIKLTEGNEKLFNSLLETLKVLKTETHAIAVPDDDSEELDTGEELDAMELDDTEELEIDDEKLEEEKNPYAICTASVGREDEKKYKSCKDKVAAKNKK
jgi:hypothetical protein